LSTEVAVLSAALRAKNSGAGATTHAEFYGYVDPVVKSFLPSGNKEAPNLRQAFKEIQMHEAEWTKDRKSAASTSSESKIFRANESNTVQIVWSAYLSEEGLTTKDKTVLKYSDIKTLKGTSRTLRWQDTHRAPSIGTRKPDECLYVAGKPSTAFYVAVVGDLKDPGDTFTDDAKGQILTFMKRLMDIQPFCQFVFGYLRNSDVVQFFRQRR
jgi:hypothetical protein